MKPKATIKAYPIKEQQENIEFWSDGQAVKRITVRFVNKPTQEEMDQVFQKVLNLGFGFFDKSTFVQDIPLSEMGAIQKQLSEIFDLTYLVT